MEKEKIRVLMMVSWYAFFDGKLQTGSFHYIQAKALQQYCEVAMYCPYDTVIGKYCVKRTEGGILTYRSQYQLEKKVRNRLYMFRSMRKIKKEFKPDVIHAHVATEAGRFAVVLGKLFHIPVMITEHSAPEGSEVDRFPHYYYAKFAYGNSKYNACVSDYLTEYLRKLFPKFEFETIYNGIETNALIKAAKQDTKKELSCAIVADFYRKEVKGFHILLPVITRLNKEGKRLFLHLIGGGEYLEYYQKEANRMGAAEWCIFHGHCDRAEVNRILCEMDFLVSASLFESFGMSIAEALLIGLPVVATASGGPNSLINRDNGILVEKGSVEALYDGISRMMQTCKDYDSDKISRQAGERFSLEIVTKKYMSIYVQVLEKKKGKGRRI